MSEVIQPNFLNIAFNKVVLMLNILNCPRSLNLEGFGQQVSN